MIYYIMRRHWKRPIQHIIKNTTHFDPSGTRGGHVFDVFMLRLL